MFNRVEILANRLRSYISNVAQQVVSHMFDLVNDDRMAVEKEDLMAIIDKIKVVRDALHDLDKEVSKRLRDKKYYDK